MKKLVLSVLALVCLAGCTTIGASPSAAVTTPAGQAVVAPTKNKLDQAIASTAQTISGYCTLASWGVAAGELFTSKPKVVAAVAKAKLVINSYCSGPPPSDVPTALAALGAAYTAVVYANAQ